MKLKAISRKNRPAEAFIGFPVDPTTLIVQLVFFLIRLIFLGLPF